MSAEWPVVELSALVDELTVGFVGSMTQEYVAEGIPFFRSKNISPYKIDWEDIRFISKKFHKKLSKSILKPGDVAIVRTGKPGTTCVIPDSITEANCSDVVIARVNNEKLNAHYLTFFMNSIATHQVNSNLVGAVQQHFNVGSAKKLKISLPPRPEQEHIVFVLKTLNDKIELNRRINQTLEQIAQAIFQSWFVDFEPVKAKILAKQNGQDPERAAMCAISGKSEADLDQLPPDQLAQLAATAALFPDELVDSELEVIPKGWTNLALSEMVQLIGGGTPKRANPEYWGGEIPWFSVQDAPTDGDAFAVSTEEMITELGVAKSSTKLLPIGTTIISARGTVGRLALTGVEMAMNQSCYGVRGIEGIGPYFNYFNLKENISTLQQNTHGAVFDTITRQTFDTVSCVMPFQSVSEKFETVVAPLMEQMRSNAIERRTLATLRDTLLPKLLSGEITVHAAQAQIKEAA